MSKLFVPEVQALTIKPTLSGSLTIGLTVFPDTDSTSRSTASFGGTSPFLTKSTYQAVTTATATIDPLTTIIGVEFDGAVSLTFPDTFTSFNQVSIIDEGGFCSPLKPITISSAGALGSLTISSPYAHLEARNNGSVLIAEAKDTIPATPVVPVPEEISDPNATTEISEDGTQTTTSEDGNSVYTINPDGSTQLSVTSGGGQFVNATVLLPDGTQIQSEEDWSGNSSSFVTNPDGSTVQTVSENTGANSSFTVAVDGTTTDFQESSSGNSTNVVVSPDGQINTDVIQNNG